MAIDRHFFQSVGAYDPGMLLWGAEQIELSIRVKRNLFYYQSFHLIHMLTRGREVTDCRCFSSEVSFFSDALTE